MLRAAKPIASEKKGAKVVKIKCSQCHTNGYSYSTANQTSGITWDAGTSFEYLNNPLTNTMVSRTLAYHDSMRCYGIIFSSSYVYLVGKLFRAPR